MITQIKSMLSMNGLPPEMVFKRTLDAIDKGISVSEIRKDFRKYILIGKKKEIIVNTGGYGVRVSREIIEEMVKREDKLALDILKNNRFNTYQINNKGDTVLFAYLEDLSEIDDPYGIRTPIYDRENTTLIQIIKEGKMRNNAGMNLMVAEVYDDPEYETYKICESDDLGPHCYEYIKGYYRKVSVMKG